MPVGCSQLLLEFEPALLKPDPPLSQRFLPTFASEPLTAAKAVAIIPSWDDLTISRRRTLCSAVRTIGRALGLPLDAITMDPEQLIRTLESVAGATAGLQPNSLRTYKNSLSYVMRRLDLLPSNRPELTAPWQALYDSVQDRSIRTGLRHFLVFVSSRGLLPDQVSPETVVVYHDHLLNQLLRRKPDKHVRRVVRIWNDAIDEVGGWPPTRLAMPIKTVRFTLPLDRYPPSLQAELQALTARLSGEDQVGLFTGNGPPTALSPGTVKSRRYNIRQALGALVELGWDPAAITSLSMLVEEAAFQAILDFYFQRAHRQKTSQLGGIASALMIVARYHACLPEGQLNTLRAYAKRAMPKRRTTMTEQNAGRLSRLDDPQTEARLVYMPRHLMNIARGLLSKGLRQQAGWTAAVAVAVKILLFCPMRSKNLVALRIDTNLARFGRDTGCITHFRVPPKDVKNKQAIEWPVHPDTSDFIQTYLEEFRPLLPYAENVWLFPGRDQGDQPRDQVGLAQAISHAIHKHVGIAMNVHLFRGYAAKVLLEESPEATDDLRQLLGHTGLETTVAYYVHFRGKAIAKRFNTIVFAKYEWAARLLADPQRVPRGGRVA